MAQPQNLERAPAGTTIALDISTVAGNPPVLTNADFVPTYEIIDPTNTVVETGTGLQIGLGKYVASYSIPLNATQNSEWRIVWNVVINGQTVANAYEYFTVLPPGAVSFANLPIISDDDLAEIKKVIGYPRVKKVLLSDDEIKYFCIRQAMHLYFNKWPKITLMEYQFAQSLVLDFPSAETFGVKDARLVNRAYGTRSNSSFWDLVKYKNMMGGRRNFSYGRGSQSHNFNGQFQADLASEQMWDTLKNKGTISITMDESNRKIRAYGNMSGVLAVSWAERSNNFNDIKHVYKYDVIELSQAYLMQHLADTSGMIQDSASERSINVDQLKTRTDEILTRIKEKWEQIPSVHLMRIL